MKPIQKIETVRNLKLPNGAVYQGEVYETRPNGRGKMRYSNNERYEGDFFKGMKHGKGKYYYMKGQLYIGDWYQNKKHGNGQYFYKNGDIYTGQFQNNLKHGKGRIQQTNDNYYQGQFFINNKDKNGTYYDVVNSKKILFIYDKGKLMGREQIPMSVEEQKRQQQQQSEFPDDLSFQNKQSDKKLSSSLQKHPLSYQVFNSGEFSSGNKRRYATNRDLKDRMKQNSSGKKEDDCDTFKPQNYIEPELLKKKIHEWGTEEVASWLNQIGFGDCIEDFKDNNIQGDSLLVLYNQDLKQLRVNALGDRRILLRQIQLLRLIFKSQCVNHPIIEYSHRQLTISLIKDLEEERQQNLSSSSSSSSSEGKTLEKSSAKLDRKDSVRSQRSKELRQMTQSKKQKQIIKKNEKMSIQSKVSQYLNKKGIKLTFLVKREELKIQKPIGKGGYGQVFLGKLYGQQVAVKRYLKKRGVRNKHIAHFIQEVQVISKLHHPCIVLYMGMCIYDNEYLLITEFLSGGSLFDYLHTKKQNISEQLLVFWLKDVSLGMAYLHSKNMLHCDLKSSNLLIDQNQNIKLCDFGLSRIISTKSKKNNKNIRVGTPHWMAPEILRGGKYECPSDVYSFGILMWEMMTGRIPYKDYSTAHIIGMVGNDEKHHIGMPNYPNQPIIDIFLSCTHRDPSLRPTFKVIVKAIEEIQNQLDNRIPHINANQL